ncbi:MAG TPA: peptidase M23 [Gammaproteobacteria bacterium]|nr:peptidase M23 [Gammaproteobacteria bacterium]
MRAALLLAAFALLSFTVQAEPDAAARAQELEQLRSQIQTLQQQLANNRKKKSRAEQQLQKVEKQIGRSARELRRIDRELRAQRSQLADLRATEKAQVLKLQRQRENLAREARAAYAMGRQQQVKLLLNQERPSAIGRMLVYFGYFSQARAERISAIHSMMDALHETETAIQQQTARLTELRSSQQLVVQQLEEKQQARKQVLASISRELQSQGGELQQLRSDAQQLQALLASLQELLADIPANSGQQQPFGSLKGKLGWPTRGRLTTRFGSRRGSSGLTWQGVIISAPEGGKVHAVAQGRVAFADWLRGFGLLLIIDHGDGYMSLYGHNQALYKEVGEWVDTDEVVATLGASGGQSRSGLYFELRHKGRPVNPLRWCTGKPAALS